MTDQNLDIIEQLIAFADSRGHTILELAFSWLASHKAVASVIAGATRPEQVLLNAQAASWKPTSEELAGIDRIVPKPRSDHKARA